MKLMRVTAVDYTTTDDDEGDELPLVQLAGRDEDGARRTLLVEDTIPHFYARSSEAEQLVEPDIRRIRDGFESFDGVPLSRIDVRVPENVGSNGSAEDLTERFEETWESDVPFYRRVCIDYGLSGHIRVPDSDRCSIDDVETDVDVSGSEVIEPRIFIADIEVLQQEDTTFDSMMEDYDCPISHISMWDSQADEYIALYLDPDDRVSLGGVSDRMDEEISADRLLDEWDRDVRLRSYETEEALLEGFIQTVESRRPDLFSGWNWVDFDWTYILGRLEEFDLHEHRLSDIGWINGYQTERKVDCLPAFDMLDAYKKMTVMGGQKRSWSLDYVAKEEIGAGKVDNVSINWAFEQDPELLLAYNIIDTMLCVAIDRKEGIHEFFYELTELCQVQIYDGFSEMRLIDGYLMSRTDDDEILPAAEEKEIPENAGGLVLEPSSGVSEWTGVVDLKSLYPSVILTWNISPETIHWYDDSEPEGDYVNVPWLPDADHADGGQFDLEDIDFDVMWSDLSEEGLIPKYIKSLFPKREEMKERRAQHEPGDDEYAVWDRRQYAVKVLMNSFYGIMSMDYWRLAVYGLGDAVTSTARFALWKGKEIAEDEGFEVIYGDTDSVMVSLADEDESKTKALERGHELEETINARMGECVDVSDLSGCQPHLTESLHGTDRHALVYEFEKLYRRFFQAGSKKRYAGNIVWKEGKDIDGEIDTVGFESQRSDSPEITEEVQPEVINRILEGEGFEEVSEYIRDLIGDIEDREMELYRVALPSSLGQPLRSYGNTQVARACRYSNDHLEYNWSMGDDPWVYFIRTTPPMTPGTDVLALTWGEDLPDGFELDLDKTLDRALKGPLKPILEEVGWRFTELKQGAQTQSAAGGEWSGDWEDDEDDDGDGWGW